MKENRLIIPRYPNDLVATRIVFKRDDAKLVEPEDLWPDGPEMFRTNNPCSTPILFTRNDVVTLKNREASIDL